MPNPTPSFFHNFRSIESNSYKAYLKLDFPVVITTKDSVSPHIIIPNSIPLQTKTKDARAPSLCNSGFKEMQEYSLVGPLRSRGRTVCLSVFSVHRSKNQKR